MRDDAHNSVAGAGAGVSSVLADYTGYLLRRAFARANRMALEAVSAGAHPRDFVVLNVLAEQDAFSQQDLAERLGINRTIMVKLIDKLEGADYVTRTRNPHDRRSYMLSVTDAGRRAMEAMGPAIADSERRLTVALEPAEHQRLNGLLRRLLPTVGPAPVQRTGYLVAQAHYLVRARHDEALAALDLHTRHFGALAALDELGPCTQQQLADELGVTETAAVQIVDDLERSDLVSRRRDPRDRRRYALELTPAGRERFAAARRAVDAVEAELRATLGSGDYADVRALLIKLLGPLDESGD